jgi:hypothetical protein
MPQLTISITCIWLISMQAGEGVYYGEASERRIEGIESIIPHLSVRVEFNYTGAQLCESEEGCTSCALTETGNDCEICQT